MDKEEKIDTFIKSSLDFISMAKKILAESLGIPENNIRTALTTDIFGDYLITPTLDDLKEKVGVLCLSFSDFLNAAICQVDQPTLCLYYITNEMLIAGNEQPKSFYEFLACGYEKKDLCELVDAVKLKLKGNKDED